MTPLTSYTAWSEALDAYEARVEACRELAEGDLDAWTAAHNRALVEGDAPVPAALVRFVPPDDLGPIPTELVPRAEAILVAGRAIEAGLAERRDDVYAQLRDVESRRAPGGFATHDAPRPRLLDQRG
jgi:hypothetical protein